MPVAALHGFGFLGLSLAHASFGLEAVVDAGGVSYDERGAVPSLCLAYGFEALAVVGSHGYLRHVDVAVRGLHEAEVFLAHALAVGRELGDGAYGGGLGGLAARVAVHFGVEHEDVHVLSAADDVVEAAVAYVI